MSSSPIPDVSEDDIPSREECQVLTEQFANITGTDSALGQFFLQDRNWKLEPALNSFYEQSKDQVNIVTDDADPDVLVTFDSGLGNLLSESKYKISTDPPKKFKILTWNVDGLDERCLKKRAKTILNIIESEKPDIVTLQEVIPIVFSYLESKLPYYRCIAAKESDYFTATFIKITTVKFDDFTVKDFSNSIMDRGLLITEVHIGSLKLKILNSHFESTAEFSAERKKQLKESFDIMKNSENDVTVLLEGDLNLRDNEVNEVSLPPGVTDVWEQCGRRNECRYTWDMMRNTNKEFPGRFKPRCRFDRIYLKPSSKTSVKPTYFGFVGIEKVKTTQIFPSDHWGIIINFDIINQCSSTALTTSSSSSSISVLPTSNEQCSPLSPSVSGCITESINKEFDSMQVDNRESNFQTKSYKRSIEEVDDALNDPDDGVLITEIINQSRSTIPASCSSIPAMPASNENGSPLSPPSSGCITESGKKEFDSMQVDNVESDFQTQSFKRRLEEIDDALNNLDDSVVITEVKSKKSPCKTYVDLDSD